MKDILLQEVTSKLLLLSKNILEGETLYKSIYWFLYSPENFLNIAECKIVHITGFSETQHLVLHLNINLNNNTSPDSFLSREGLRWESNCIKSILTFT